MIKKFQRTKENFICKNCGKDVVGDGYTNHCPRCLYSKHVDVMPGDRKETCHGLMEPVGVLQERNVHVIVHKCTRCNKKIKTKANTKDDIEKIISLSNNPIIL